MDKWWVKKIFQLEEDPENKKINSIDGKLTELNELIEKLGYTENTGVEVLNEVKQ